MLLSSLVQRHKRTTGKSLKQLAVDCKMSESGLCRLIQGARGVTLHTGLKVLEGIGMELNDFSRLVREFEPFMVNGRLEATGLEAE